MKEVVLAIMIATSATGGGGVWDRTKYYKQPDMETCLKVLAVTKLETPDKADDNEWVASATCTYR